MRLTCIVLAAVAVFGCGGPQPGEPCVPSDSRCDEDGGALLCDEGTMGAFPCRGPLGCEDTTTGAVCDQRVAAAGDPCPQAFDGALACDDVEPGWIRDCRSGSYRYVTEACDGQCTMAAEVGAPAACE